MHDPLAAARCRLEQIKRQREKEYRTDLVLLAITVVLVDIAFAATAWLLVVNGP